MTEEMKILNFLLPIKGAHFDAVLHTAFLATKAG